MIPFENTCPDDKKFPLLGALIEKYQELEFADRIVKDVALKFVGEYEEYSALTAKKISLNEFINQPIYLLGIYDYNKGKYIIKETLLEQHNQFITDLIKQYSMHYTDVTTANATYLAYYSEANKYGNIDVVYL